MALGRCRISPCHLVRNQPTICSIHALNAPTRPRLAPTIGTSASRTDPSCTAAASEISIAPADRTAPLSRGFLPWRHSNAGPATLVRVESSVMGPASETRHNSPTRALQQKGKPIRSPRRRDRSAFSAGVSYGGDLLSLHDPARCSSPGPRPGLLWHHIIADQFRSEVATVDLIAHRCGAPRMLSLHPLIN